MFDRDYKQQHNVPASLLWSTTAGSARARGRDSALVFLPRRLPPNVPGLLLSALLALELALRLLLLLLAMSTSESLSASSSSLLMSTAALADDDEAPDAGAAEELSPLLTGMRAGEIERLRLRLRLREAGDGEREACDAGVTGVIGAEPEPEPASEPGEIGETGDAGADDVSDMGDSGEAGAGDIGAATTGAGAELRGAGRSDGSSRAAGTLANTLACTCRRGTKPPPVGKRGGLGRLPLDGANGRLLLLLLLKEEELLLLLQALMADVKPMRAISICERAAGEACSAYGAGRCAWWKPRTLAIASS